jgi:hypothetical protein
MADAKYFLRLSSGGGSMSFMYIGRSSLENIKLESTEVRMCGISFENMVLRYGADPQHAERKRADRQNADSQHADPSNCQCYKMSTPLWAVLCSNNHFIS